MSDAHTPFSIYPHFQVLRFPLTRPANKTPATPYHPLIIAASASADNVSDT